MKQQTRGWKKKGKTEISGDNVEVMKGQLDN